MPILRILFALIALLALNAAAQQIPTLEGETLDARKTDLRKQTGSSHTAIIFGFTREAQPAMTHWTRQLQSAFPPPAPLTVYNVVNLQKAPFFVRGIIKSGIRKDVPASMHARFLILTTQDREWRQFFGVTAASEQSAWLLLLGPDGKARMHEELPAATAPAEFLVGKLKAALPPN